tara:strand:+ start:732 stop:1859 length:1128 start_codon:yes stop_codon:yes gene_type:complete
MSRILVDLLGYTGDRGGTETYVRALMSRIPALMPGSEFIALANRPSAAAVEAFFPGSVRVVPWAGRDRATWALGAISATSRVAKRVGADLIWCPSNFGPITGTHAPLIVTVHDVIYDEVRGSGLSRLSRAITSWLMGRTARESDLVLTVSDSAASSISARLSVSESRIRRVYNGASGLPRNPPDPHLATLAGVPSDRRVVLSTGNRMPHKNFVGLLTALTRIDEADRPFAVIPGSHGTDPLAAAVARLGLEKDVLLPGWVEQDVLEAFYARANLYVCPSLAEGFGLPVLDAMARGCPVLANDIPVLREIGGAFVSYADARDVTEFAAAIRTCASIDPSDEWLAGGRQRASGFSWDATAAGVAATFESALTQGRAE